MGMDPGVGTAVNDSLKGAFEVTVQYGVDLIGDKVNA